MFTRSLGSSIASSLITGYLFDAYGPRRIAIGGAVAVSVAFVLMTVALVFPAADNLIWVAATLADCAGSLTSLTVYGFTWYSTLSHRHLIKTSGPDRMPSPTTIPSRNRVSGSAATLFGHPIRCASSWGRQQSATCADVCADVCAAQFEMTSR